MVINERRELAEGFLAAISAKLRLGMAAGIDGVWTDRRWKEVDRLTVVQSLWKGLAAKYRLPQTSKDWLEAKAPLIKVMEDRIQQYEWQELLYQLAIYNPDLIHKVADSGLVELQFPTLKACLRMEIGDPAMWNKLMPGGGRRDCDETTKRKMGELLAVAMTDDNRVGEQWVLNYNPGIEQRELLLRGINWLGRGTLNEEKLERLLGLIDYQAIDFEVLREVFPDYETLERVKIKMDRAHLERMVPPSLARAGKQGKPHL